MDTIFTLNNILNLTTLTGLEIVLGIDNVIFIALLVHHLPTKDRTKVRVFGLSLALILRVLLLFAASWMIGLTKPIFTLFSFPFSGRSILLIGGGLFLVVKSILEIIELFDEHEDAVKPNASNGNEKFWKIVAQIIFIDLVLSFDSVITAVGMTNNLPIIIIAIVIAMIVMLFSSKPIGDFMYAHPSVKVIALAFILLVGVLLVAGGFDIEIPKGYLYFSMFFAMFVEIINILLAKKRVAHTNLGKGK
jgi:predicted tellurium resistance membrane protein TerC